MTIPAQLIAGPIQPATTGVWRENKLGGSLCDLRDSVVEPLLSDFTTETPRTTEVAQRKPFSSGGGHSGLSFDDSPTTEVEATKRRTEITVETHRVLRISGSNASATCWCDKCGEQVWMVSPEQAAVLADVPTRLVYRWVEDGRLHLLERPDVLLVCINSLKVSVTAGFEERRQLL